MDITTKTGLDAAKTAFKRVFQKIAETKGYLIGKKVADKIISVDETKNKEKEDERQEIYIALEKGQQIIDDLRLFLTQYKNGMSKNEKPARYNI